MPRTFSTVAQPALQAPSTNEAFIALITIAHPASGTLFRIAANTEDIVSRGNTYKAYALQLVLPVESGEEIGSAQVVIDNTDLLLIDMVRRITTPAQFTIEIVLASSPDVVELTVNDLMLREVSWDASQITGKLMLEDVLNQRFPKGVFDPAQYAGLF